MIRNDLSLTLLTYWSFAVGIALWLPGIGLPVAIIHLQPMDLLALLAWPLALIFIRRFPPQGRPVLALFLASLLACWLIVGGELLVFIWTLLFALPIVFVLSIALSKSETRQAFLQGFLCAAALSVIFFMIQILFGAETLDYRNNTSFKLPPHFGRGFALFPEVSTFAAHTILAAGVCFVLWMHQGSSPILRRRAALLCISCLLALMYSRSTSVIVLLPLVVILALAVTQKLTLNTVIFVFILALASSALLVTFLQVFYADRLESNAASRSAAMRLASILGGLSPLWQAEIFGVGIGENGQVSYRALEAARQFNLDFGKLPEGINSHLVTRIFEEGWPAALHIIISANLLWRAKSKCRNAPDTAALFVLAAGAMLVALLVIGYRGIYTNWVWLAGAAALAPDFSSAKRGRT